MSNDKAPNLNDKNAAGKLQEKIQEALRSVEGKRMVSWRSKDMEGDIWSEKSLVFPKGEKRETFFTEENMYKLFNVGKEDYPHCEITFEDFTVYVKIYALADKNDEDSEEELYTDCEFVEMNGALVFG